MNESHRTSPPRVSVALCTFNGSRFIRQQLESIAGQTHAVNEVVVCDDGSNDGTVDLIKAFAGTSPVPVTVRVNDQRLGVTKNFEKAISLCGGDVLFLCDQDDLWHPRKVERLLSCFDDPAVGLAFSNAQVVDENLGPVGYRLWDSVWFDLAEQRQMSGGNALPVLLRHAIAAGSTLAFRAAFSSLILPIPDFPHSHDIWITLLIAATARIVPLDEDLIQYRLHSSNHVGMRRHGLLGQVRMARQQIEVNAFGYAADLHKAAYDRLVANPDRLLVRDALRLLDEKIRHSRLRHDLPRRRLARLGTISSELRNGNYSKYSYGYKSVLQDLILR